MKFHKLSQDVLYIFTLNTVFLDLEKLLYVSNNSFTKPHRKFLSFFLPLSLYLFKNQYVCKPGRTDLKHTLGYRSNSLCVRTVNLITSQMLLP